MARKKILIDSGFLYVLFNPKHKDYHKAQNTVAEQDADFVVPYVTLTEAAYLSREKGSVTALAYFLDSLVRADLPFEPVTPDDLKRAREIVMTYATAKFDFVDCCLMAISERLNITEICTTDHRDFSIFRPKHCDYLTLLP